MLTQAQTQPNPPSAVSPMDQAPRHVGQISISDLMEPWRIASENDEAALRRLEQAEARGYESPIPVPAIIALPGSNPPRPMELGELHRLDIADQQWGVTGFPRTNVLLNWSAECRKLRRETELEGFYRRSDEASRARYRIGEQIAALPPLNLAEAAFKFKVLLYLCHSGDYEIEEGKPIFDFQDDLDRLAAAPRH